MCGEGLLVDGTQTHWKRRTPSQEQTSRGFRCRQRSLRAYTLASEAEELSRCCDETAAMKDIEMMSEGTVLSSYSSHRIDSRQSLRDIEDICPPSSGRLI